MSRSIEFVVPKMPGSSLIPFIVQSEGVFNVGIMVTINGYAYCKEEETLIHSRQGEATFRERLWLQKVVCKKSKGEEMVVDDHESKNYEALFALVHYL